MARSESTIADVKTLDIETLVSDGFSVESYIGTEKAAQLNIASAYLSKEEIESEISMGAFLRNIGVDRRDISANIWGAKALADEETTSGLWKSVKEGWHNNDLQMRIADIRWDELNNLITPEEAMRQTDILKAQMRSTKSKGFSSWAKSAATLVPMMIETTGYGAKVGLVAGGGAVAVTSIAHAGPQAPFTISGAFLAAGGAGMVAGTTARAAQIEAGLFYDELMNMKVDPVIGKPLAYTLGVINGLLELAQITDIVKTIPGGRKLLARAQKKTLMAIVKNPSLKTLLAKGVIKYGGHVGFETGTEVIQEADNIIFGELAKQINNSLLDTDLKPATREEMTNRIVETAKESAKGFSLIAGPGNIMQTMADVSGARAERPPTDVIVPVKRISKAMPAKEIKTRVDLKSLGKVLVDIEAPLKKVRVKKEKMVTPPTIEEEYLLQQTEKTLAAAEPHKISPELYIGNVTERMRRVWAEALDAAPEDIRPFLDGAFPTKRTKIELTMGEARNLLFYIEANLQQRLDNNQINTENDLAYANADWGDIKTLREAMGLPKTKRPFQVIRNPGTKVLTIDNVARRLKAATQLSRTDTIMTTEIERLNSVLRKAAKMAKEAYKAAIKTTREAYAAKQYLKRQRALRLELIERIQKKPSEKIDFFYREAIAGFQDAIDFRAVTEEKIERKETLRKLLRDNPERESEIPQKILDTLEKKNVANLSYSDLQMLNDEIQRLSKLGKLKSALYRKQRAAALSKATTGIADNISKARKVLLPLERALSLRPMRIFDMLDGGKKYKGNNVDFFYNQANEDYDTELQNVDARHSAFRQKMIELGMRLTDLMKKRTVGDITLTLDDWLSIWAGWKNPASRAALKYGGIGQRTKGVITYLPVTDELYNKIDESLTEREKLLADTIIAEYDQHYDRVRNTVIRAENRDPGRQENYTKIRRMDVEYKTTEQEMMDELALRHFFSQVGPHKAFTIPRMNIPPEFQKPMQLGLVRIWTEEVRRQEHYIANALHLKDMRAIANKSSFRNAVVDKFGQPMMKTVDTYIDKVANPAFYKAQTDLEKVSQLLRQHTAIAYIAYNLSTILKQAPSLMMYWAHSSAADILIATLDTALHPRVAWEAAVNIHYQIRHQAIEREMVELQQANGAAYQKIINKVGRAGMYGIYMMDRTVRVIGINAVYNYGIRNGLSPNEAARNASKVTLLTQPAAAAKDLARIYSSSEFLNWFTMFTNQLNQIYNIATYDIPSAFLNKNYQESARSIMALSTMAMMIWMITNKRVPEDAEDATEAIAENALNSIPLFGGGVVSGAKGWRARVPAPLQAAERIGKAVKEIKEGDIEDAMSELVEPVSVVTGFPYLGAKKAIEFIEEIK